MIKNNLFPPYIQDNLPEALYFCKNDRVRTVIEINKSACILLGIEQKSDESIQLRTFLHTESSLNTDEIIWDAVSAKKDYSIDYLITTKHGSNVWVNDHGVGIFSDQGECVGIIGCLKDITQFVSLQEELMNKRVEAEKISQAKSKFIATLNHELRAPVSGIIGLSGLLLNSQLNVEQKRQIENIKESGEILLSLINDILDFSKIVAGKLELEIKKFSLLKMSERTLGLIETLAKDKNINLSISISPDLPELIVGDQTRLQQVLMNLLGNAVKFTEQGFVRLTIRKTVTSKQDFIHFEVIDTGIGIAENNLGKLFKDFTQGHVGIGRSYGGTGLGLSICKSLVTLMGGTIGVVSTEGKGSTFWFEIPLIEENGLDSHDHMLQDKRKLNLLVVEDNLINQEVILGLIRTIGDDAKIASNGQEAINLFREEPFDVILTDINMPVMDGVTAAQEIRKHPNGKHIPIIAVTANSIASDHAEYLRHGITSVMTKPIDKEKLFLELMPYRKGPEIISKTEDITMDTKQSSSLIQVETLKGLVEDLGKEKILKLLEIYKGDAINLMSHIESGPSDERHRSAHTLAGMAENLGILSVGKVARTIMSLPETADDDAIKVPLKELRTIYEASLKEVNKVVE